MTNTFVEIERLGGVTVIRLNRPPHNALEIESTTQLADSLELVQDGTTTAIVLTGDGDRFSAGLDLKVVPLYHRSRQRQLLDALNRLVLNLYGCPLPTVAAINGHAVAAGTLLTLACDYRVGPTTQCRFGLPGARVGIPYPLPAWTVFEAELAPAVRRMMLLTARTFDAHEAMAKGVIDELQPPKRVLDRAITMALEMAQMPQASFAAVKLRLRSEAIARIKEGMKSEVDPFLADWLVPKRADD